jgi:hypothetical protein
MKYLNRWAKGKHLGLVMIAQRLAISGEGCFEFLRLIKSGEKIGLLSSIPKDKEWVSLYRNHRGIELIGRVLNYQDFSLRIFVAGIGLGNCEALRVSGLIGLTKAAHFIN